MADNEEVELDDLLEDSVVGGEDVPEPAGDGDDDDDDEGVVGGELADDVLDDIIGEDTTVAADEATTEATGTTGTGTTNTTSDEALPAVEVAKKKEDSPPSVTQDKVSIVLVV